MCSKPSRIVALWCWYHGGTFRGYQSQPQGPTVQDTLISSFRKAALSRNPVASGRTDLGVHARMQVLSFRLPEPLDPEALPAAINAHLPPGLVGIALARRVRHDFHAHWKASEKEYRYRAQTAVDPTHVAALLARAVGTRDFFAFHDKASPRRLRTLTSVEVLPREGGLEARLVGPGFGRYMVRFLVGSALAVAAGELPEAVYLRGLESGTPFGAVKAPPGGLTLWEVRYPAEYDPFSAEERRLAPGVPREPPFDG